MTKETGLVILHTGNGKGKTTAALGLALRAWGGGAKVLVLQFIKGGQTSGELTALERLAALDAPGKIELRQLGLGFSQKGDDPAPHKEAARTALVAAKEALDGTWDMVVLDEILYAVKFGLIEQADVEELIKSRSPEVHVVLTGRGASPELIGLADLVTEMGEIKHPYAQGIKARRWIEF